jgi:hypothetical protein
MKIITNDFGQIKLGAVLLQGTFESLEITTDGEIDESEIKNSKKKQIEILGFGLSSLKLTIKLQTDTKSTSYDKLSSLQALFKKDPKKPSVYQMTNKHTAVRGIDKVIFQKLRTHDTNDDDILLATLDFLEYNPTIVAIKTVSSKASSPAKAKAPTGKTPKKTDKTPIRDYKHERMRID